MLSLALSARAVLRSTLVAWLIAAIPAPASAELSVGVGTDLPLDLSARVDHEDPAGLRLSVSLGYLPTAYAQATSDLLVSLGAWSQDTGDLVMQTLRSSLVARVHAGWRPFADAGFYFALGYGLLAFGGDTTRGAVLGAATGLSIPLSARSGDYEISAVVHQVDVELGWQWRLGEHLIIRAALGGAFTAAASVTVRPPELSIPFLESSFADDAAAELHDLITRYLHAPTLTLSAAYAF